MSSKLPFSKLLNAAKQFALPQVDIVSPSLVVACGENTFSALSVATGRKPVRPLSEAISSPFWVGDSMVWCQAHPGALGFANRNRGGVDRVSSDWGKMAAWYRRKFD